MDAVGANAKMNEFCAAMGLCNLRHVDAEIAKRKAVAEAYGACLEGIEGIQLNPVQKYVTPNYSYFPVIFMKRNLEQRGMRYKKNWKNMEFIRENIFIH